MTAEVVVDLLPPNTKWRCALAVFYSIIAYQIWELNHKAHDGQNFATIEKLRTYAVEVAIQVLIGFVFTAVHCACRRVFYPLSDSWIKRKSSWTQKSRDARRERWCSSIFKFTYFAIISIFAWVTLRDQEWMPPSMGGRGSLVNLLPSETREGFGDRLFYVDQGVPDSVHFYYRIASGYHMSELIFQVMFEWNRPDFYDMLLHHICTCWLLFFSMMAGCQRHGTLVLFIHDFTDVPAYMGKFFVDAAIHVSGILSSFGLVLLTWGYLRLYVFPTIIWSILVYAPQVDFPGWQLFAFLLSALVSLHCFWYYKFIQMAIRYAGAGVVEDSVANLQQLGKYLLLNLMQNFVNFYSNSFFDDSNVSFRFDAFTITKKYFL